ncbi:phage tail protein (plasmid) [Staphylococcus carnosus]|uniref:major tail protein n=1 Tax=Staphylococcus carnosus TaxID=1281 RepID=UPI00191A880E|nr:major tail protein [Staphylococcus carnosus]QQS86541.1 phage tail protein [Staphylococcus carnosus]
MAKKMTSSFTGLDYFHYKILNEDAGVKTPQRIEGLQEITISKDQEVVKAHGDNRTMETAVSNGDVELESGFHTLDLQTKADLFGLESQDGIYAVGNDTPNDVACILVRTNAVGREIVGLMSGKFTFSEIEGETQSDDIEFSSQSTTGTFIPVNIEGYDKPKAMLMGFDKKGETTALYSIWKKVFGEAHPEDGSSVTEPVEENTGA